MPWPVKANGYTNSDPPGDELLPDWGVKLPVPFTFDALKVAVGIAAGLELPLGSKG